MSLSFLYEKRKSPFLPLELSDWSLISTSIPSLLMVMTFSCQNIIIIITIASLKVRMSRDVESFYNGIEEDFTRKNINKSDI